MIFAQNNDAKNSLPAIIYLLQSEQEPVKDIALGGSHACALLESGTIKCWGSNGFGQLGNNSTINSPYPVRVHNITNAIAIAAGTVHTCAIVKGGSIKCWGSGLFGRLGHASENNALLPVSVIGIDNAVTIAAGANHSCARVNGGLFTGPVKCWGSNSDGQLGDGSTTNSTIPVDVANLANALTLSLGTRHSCARIGASLGGGTIQCWGSDFFGQLGNGNASNDDALVPVSVSGINNAKVIGVHGAHSCAVLADKTAMCWGLNSGGQLGDGTMNIANSPVQVISIRGFGSIAAGSRHTCATTRDNSSPFILCWGDNQFGALGDGTNNNSLTTVKVTGLDADKAILDSGDNFSCALLSNGSVQCWGLNLSGQLGNGSLVNSNSPKTVLGL